METRGIEQGADPAGGRPQIPVAAAEDGHAARCGAHEVEDHAQWLQVSASGTLAVRNAIAWLLYDADFAFQADGEGDGSVALPGSGKPAWLMVYGAPGAVVEVQIIA